MQGINEYYYTRVITSEGVRDLRDLHPLDIVYEYHSGIMMPVFGMKSFPIQDMLRITYTDGRTMDVGYDDQIYTGDNTIMTAYDALMNPQCWHEIKQYPLSYHRKRLHAYRETSPYLAGALLMYGDFDEDYINLPLDKAESNPVIRYLLDGQYTHTLDRYIAEYYLNGDHHSLKIKWNDVFPNDNIYPLTRRIHDHFIPDRYMYGSSKVIDMFIRGAFDIGYDPEMFPDTVAIVNRYEYRLIALQKMLWSRGICSLVSYDPTLIGGQYRLDLVGDHVTYPGNFYNVEFIEKQIDNTNFGIKDDFKLKIEKIEKIKPGYKYGIILDKPNRLFMCDNYLPMPSI